VIPILGVNKLLFGLLKPDTPIAYKTIR